MLHELIEAYKLNSPKERKPTLCECMVVGLDLFGDEFGRPYCPFVTNSFLKFVLDMRRLHNAQFGIRIHCGENVPVLSSKQPAFRMFASHMYICFRALEFLKGELKQGIRIGHGVTFVSVFSDEFISGRKSDVLLAEICAMRRVFDEIPFEVNLTSNLYLLQHRNRRDRQNRHVVPALLKEGLKPVLSTDDDGIWPIDHCPNKGHLGHHSLAAEFCHAISDRLVVDVDTLKSVANEALNRKFWKQEARGDGSSRRNDPDSKADRGIFYIILHPNIVAKLKERVSQQGDFYAFLKTVASQTVHATKLPQENETNLLRVAAACFFILRQKAVTQFTTECANLFEDNLQAKKVFDLCSAILSAFGPGTSDTAASVALWKENKGYLFCSEHLQDNGSLFNVVRMVRDFANAQLPNESRFVHAFSTTLRKASWNTQLLPLTDGLTELRMHVTGSWSNDVLSAFDLRGNVYLNSPGNKRLLPEGREQFSCFVIACPHGSAVTAALHFLAFADPKHVDYHPDNFDIASRIVPFAPLPTVPAKMADAVPSLGLRTDPTLSYPKVEWSADVISLYNDTLGAKSFSFWSIFGKRRTSTEQKKFWTLILQSLKKGCVPQEFCEVLVSTRGDLFDDLATKSAVPVVVFQDKALVCTQVHLLTDPSILTCEELWASILLYRNEITLEWFITLLEVLAGEGIGEDFSYNLWGDCLVWAFKQAISCSWTRDIIRRWEKIVLHIQTNEAAFLTYAKGKKLAEYFVSVLSDTSPYHLKNPWQWGMLSTEIQEFWDNLETKLRGKEMRIKALQEEAENFVKKLQEFGSEEKEQILGPVANLLTELLEHQSSEREGRKSQKIQGKF